MRRLVEKCPPARQKSHPFRNGDCFRFYVVNTVYLTIDGMWFREKKESYGENKNASSKLASRPIHTDGIFQKYKFFHLKSVKNVSVANVLRTIPGHKDRILRNVIMVAHLPFGATSRNPFRSCHLGNCLGAARTEMTWLSGLSGVERIPLQDRARIDGPLASHGKHHSYIYIVFLIAIAPNSIKR